MGNCASLGKGPKWPANLPLEDWNEQQVSNYIKSYPVLAQYAENELMGTTGVVLANATDQVFLEAGIANGLHRLQLIAARDKIVNMQDADLDSTGNLSKSSKRQRKPKTTISQLQEMPLADDAYGTIRGKTTRGGELTKWFGQQADMTAVVTQMSWGTNQHKMATVSEYLSMGYTGAIPITADSIDKEVIRVLPTGTIVKQKTEMVPESCNSIVSLLGSAYQLYKEAYYNNENCKQLLYRACAVQDIILRNLDVDLELAIVRMMEEIILEMCTFFRLFSYRGWLVRLIYVPNDKAEFKRLDTNLLNLVHYQSCLPDGAVEMLPKTQHSYDNDAKLLMKQIAKVGGMEGLRGSPNTMVALAPYLQIGQSQLVDLIQMELSVYDDNIDIAPVSVIRNPDMQTFWRRNYHERETLLLAEFWRSFPRNLEGETRKAVTEILADPTKHQVLRDYLECGGGDQISLVNCHFLFPSSMPVEELILKVLSSSTVFRGHTRSQELSPKLSMTGNRPTSPSYLNDYGFLFGFPKMPMHPLVDIQSNAEEAIVALENEEVRLGVLLGSYGSGRRCLANAVGRGLVSNHVWSLAYWVNLSGCSTAKTAIIYMQLQMGISVRECTLAPVMQFLDRYNGIIGLCICGLDDLKEDGEAFQEFAQYIQECIEGSDNLQVLVVSQKWIDDSSKQYQFVKEIPVNSEVGRTIVDQELVVQPQPSQQECEQISQLLDHNPLLIVLYCKIRSEVGVTHEDFLELYEETSSFAELQWDKRKNVAGTSVKWLTCPKLSQQCLRALTTLLLLLDDELLHALYILSCIPGRFKLEEAFDILLLSKTDNQTSATISRLHNRGLIEYNHMQDVYTMPFMIKSHVQEMGQSIMELPSASIKVELVNTHADLLSTVVVLQNKNSQSIAGLYYFDQHLAAFEHSIDVIVEGEAATQETYKMALQIVWQLLPVVQKRLQEDIVIQLCTKTRDMAQMFYDEVGEAQASIKLGNYLVELDRGVDAEQHFDRAIEIFDSKLEMADDYQERYLQPMYAQCLQGKSGCAGQVGQNEDAIDILEQCCQVLEQVFGEVHETIGEVLLQRSKANEKCQRQMDAQEDIQRAIKIFEKLNGLDSSQVADCYFAMGKLKQGQGKSKYEEAVQHYNQALVTYQRSHDPDESMVSDVLLQLGTLEKLMGYTAHSEGHFRRCMEMREKVFGRYHMKTAEACLPLADLYRAGHKTSKALPLFERIQVIKQKVLGPKHVEVGYAMRACTDVLTELGKYQEALDISKRAIDVLEQHAEHDDMSISKLKVTQANIMVKAGDADSGAALAKKMLLIQEEALGQDHPTVAHTLVIYANATREQGLAEESIDIGRRSLDIRQKKYGKNNIVTADSMKALAQILVDCNQLDEAEELIRHCIQIRERVLGHNNPQLASSLEVMAEIMSKREELLDAEQFAKRCLEIREHVYGGEHPEVAAALILVGGIQFRLSLLQDSKHYLERALTISLNMLGAQHPLSLKAEKWLSRCR